MDNQKYVYHVELRTVSWWTKKSWLTHYVVSGEGTIICAASKYGAAMIADVMTGALNPHYPKDKRNENRYYRENP